MIRFFFKIQIKILNCALQITLIRTHYPSLNNFLWFVLFDMDGREGPQPGGEGQERTVASQILQENSKTNEQSSIK